MAGFDDHRDRWRRHSTCCLLGWQFRVPRYRQLCVADISAIATWRGLFYVAFAVLGESRRWRPDSIKRVSGEAGAIQPLSYGRLWEAVEILIHGYANAAMFNLEISTRAS